MDKKGKGAKQEGLQKELEEKTKQIADLEGKLNS